MSKSHDRLCNETRDILCAKFVDVHKVIVRCQVTFATSSHSLKFSGLLSMYIQWEDWVRIPTEKNLSKL